MAIKEEKSKKIDLKAKDFLRIIEKCAVCGVSELSVGDFHIKFDDKSDEARKQFAMRSNQSDYQKQAANQPDNMEFDVQTKEIMRGYREAQKMIDDPFGFEQQFIDQDVEEARLAKQETDN